LDKIHTSKTKYNTYTVKPVFNGQTRELQQWPLLAGGLWNYLYDFHGTN